MKFYFFFLLIGTIIISGIFFDYFGFTFDLFLNFHKVLRSFVEESFLISIIIFTTFYFFSTAFSFPLGTVLTLIGGYLFNIFYGFIAVITGATLGALTLFLIVRSGLMKTPQRKYEKSKMFLTIKAGIEKDLWGYLFFIRFFPIFPFWLVNVVPALLNLRLFPYLITTFFGIMPATLFITILGSGIDDILDNHLRDGLDLFTYAGFMLVLCALSFISIFPVIYKKFKREQ